MNAAQWLASYEPFQRFDTQRKLASRQRALPRKAARTQSWQLIVGRVFRAIDDPQVLTPTTLDRRLQQPLRTSRDEVERLDYHALPALPGQLLPPVRSLVQRQ